MRWLKHLVGLLQGLFEVVHTFGFAQQSLQFFGQVFALWQLSLDWPIFLASNAQAVEMVPKVRVAGSR